MKTYLGGGNSGGEERVEETVDGENALNKRQGAEAEEEVTGAAAPDATTGTGQGTGGMKEKNEPAAQDGEAVAEAAGVYEFPDTKTTGTVTVVKKWDDQSTNAERPRADISISTQKPSKSPLGYTVTFHADAANGLTFPDGKETNEVVYNKSGQIVSGNYLDVNGVKAVWMADKSKTKLADINEDGSLNVELNEDADFYAKVVTFEIKGYTGGGSNDNGFKQAIPNTVTTIVFTDEAMPAGATLIDVDADGDGGVVAWTEENGTAMKVSTQIKGVKVQAAKNSRRMFCTRSQLKSIDFANLDTSQVTSMDDMFFGCRGLTSLDLSVFDTAKVTSMSSMFDGCSGLTSLDLSPLDTSQVTSMYNMFSGCSGLTSLDLSPLDTSKVTNMGCMFSHCSRLTSLDLTTLDTPKVADMALMFFSCSGLTSLDLSPLDTSQVTDMKRMFHDCSGLKSLDLTQLDTSKVTDMSSMFDNCRSLTSLDLSSFDTSQVPYMSSMFSGCSGLTRLDLSPLDTSQVTGMRDLFSGCSGLTSLDLSKFDTSKVTSMDSMFQGCSGLTSLDLSSFNTSQVRYMDSMFNGCSGLTTLTTGVNFRFIGANYALTGTWQNTAGETFTSGSFPSNVADTYTKVS